MGPQTLFHKLWRRHVVKEPPDGMALLYVDRQLVYEVTSPQAFEGLRLSGRKVWRPETVLATVDHNVPTTARHLEVAARARELRLRLEPRTRGTGTARLRRSGVDRSLFRRVAPRYCAARETKCRPLRTA
ncbi:MAG: leuC [Gammaproteobacteria bacterium]|nr:leuC [Gammaproteobacteria bacterium]